MTEMDLGEKSSGEDISDGEPAEAEEIPDGDEE